MSSPRRLSPPARALEGAVLFYQKHVSPLKMGSSCRFEPTCSSYALGAVRHYGAVRGLVMATVRLSKCGPWHPGGYDPVPEKNDFKES
ncbi:MAG: membrane protein insertion efficiency factor YidD [Corynebacterium sp.]|uniref:membrane protein insertion efficiency factor YidD n=1 Tax=Corynebacterium sp. TaxID=1720 RepID=UPI0026E0B3E2|nr:membrane protein insertion efficiency factor YidD [Corynebacterium sp.]MDO5671131.1 membrane protein insertion efficiency factor YidD [Corynebacterium sp.]